MEQTPQQQNSELPTTGTIPGPQHNSTNDLNIGTVGEVDGNHAEFATANAGYAINSSTTAATTEPQKHSWKERILEEVREVGLVMGYLATSFCIIQTFRCATILARCSENDFMTSYATAGISAVVLGKFVFIIDKMRIAKRFSSYPLIIPVLYKTALFTVAANVLMHLEAKFLHHGKAEAASPAMSDPTAFLLCSFAHQLAIAVTFLVFFVFRDISRVLGKGRLQRMFFVSQD
ncbi:MAG: hypothetical protein SGJ27_12445 [Candidatus Melainabacteria bacterium]|nr:hypothetical protein [Candidatus Melainabacteria bacterium]